MLTEADDGSVACFKVFDGRAYLKNSAHTAVTECTRENGRRRAKCLIGRDVQLTHEVCTLCSRTDSGVFGLKKHIFRAEFIAHFIFNQLGNSGGGKKYLFVFHGFSPFG